MTPEENEKRLEENRIFKIENTKKVVYITGCLGFMGSYLTRTCLKRGWYIRGVDKIT